MTDISVEEPAPAVDDAPEVIVVDTGDDADNSGNDLEIGLTLGALAAEMKAVREEIAALRETQTIVAADAAIAVDTAIEAVVIADDAATAAEIAAGEAEDAADEATQEIIEPQREHPLWRNKISIGHRDDNV